MKKPGVIGIGKDVLRRSITRSAFLSSKSATAHQAKVGSARFALTALPLQASWPWNKQRCADEALKFKHALFCWGF